MTASPTISVVIPTYNRGALLERALASVYAQTLPAHQIVVVDDGSHDDTAARMEGHRGRVHYLRQQNAGAGVARNTGMQAATGDWIAFLDSDDVFAPDHLQRLAAAIAATGGGPALFFRDTQEEGLPQTFWQKTGFAAAAPFAVQADAMAWALLPIQPILPSSLLVHRQRALGVGGMPALPMREDTGFLFRMALAGPWCAVAGIGVLLSSAAGGERLTVQVSPNTWKYWDCTLSLYREAWQRSCERDRREPAADRRQTAVLRWRLQNAVWRIGRLAMQQGLCAAGIGLLVRAKAAWSPWIGDALLHRAVARAAAVIGAGVAAAAATAGAGTRRTAPS